MGGGDTRVGVWLTCGRRPSSEANNPSQVEVWVTRFIACHDLSPPHQAPGRPLGRRQERSPSCRGQRGRRRLTIGHRHGPSGQVGHRRPKRFRCFADGIQFCWESRFPSQNFPKITHLSKSTTCVAMLCAAHVPMITLYSAIFQTPLHVRIT